MPYDTDSLFSIWQQDRESLWDFVVYFKSTTMNVYNLDEFVAMLVMKRGLCFSLFTYSLDKKSSRSYSKLLLRTLKYIRVNDGDST